ncbi:MAG: metal-dependent transcriptional regulator [Clostridia bacterium]|nr:metal-dependent transcriptional regulator [Clostridia bacterium]
MKSYESEEMYLETILVLKEKMPSVHSVNIAEELNYSRPSVSRAVNLLQKKAYIEINKSGEISFTKKGLERATNIYERHQVVTELLSMIGADKELAEDNACRIEHVISEELFSVMKNFLKKRI